jgi:hypothetical protein
MVIIIAKEGQRPIRIERRYMFSQIVFAHLVPRAGAPVAIAFDKHMARQMEKGLLCGLTDRGLIVEVLRLLQELPLVFRNCIHTASWSRQKRFQTNRKQSSCIPERHLHRARSCLGCSLSPCALQTPPHGDAPALPLSFGSMHTWTRDLYPPSMTAWTAHTHGMSRALLRIGSVPLVDAADVCTSLQVLGHQLPHCSDVCALLQL